ncbi:FeoB-associated Cys-rich membrane protein [Vibrio europaeus]|uniref:FeoB-associated Cys-rich membrane protein n=1 Tax=Vibrio europaeus TaxID=300876 RepID=A0AAE7AQB7_9VIBR|nr:FeoB-associated Cys-rich membrane protein [Vibrio europaeus]MDC5803997.1 FeoB-associated Cys-rich membrane protein [Vibrio europaeus]MDC5809334.1 FeoB-associated Cys-rich membrane protein [Vibrio europaeus]MDC5820777.1 FeoB-associated Cys-rich membrane protein [Vibrio europaeus]MDC5824950.1 FeoB-associated Cys-rich membrane protein [Vibrio europaeus]MDC5829371.1 FeoB-associated Cys-rich membrane protein [Vibrio europaeus]
MYQQNVEMWDILTLVVVVAIAVGYLYFRLVKKKGSCGSGCGGDCASQAKKK